MSWLERLNTMDEREATQALRGCCGSSAWASKVVRARPFRTTEALLAASEQAWSETGAEDWREAFSHHPKIGDLEGARKRFGASDAGKEQSGVVGAAEATLQALAEGNHAYEGRFGFIFIVCATGKNADEMLALLRSRLANGPQEELRIAAAEQSKITRLRLERLATS
jgi:2-oxo-4-hydroxy-4-carboxy-5-ureidoimidazoline decarboxylase